MSEENPAKLGGACDGLGEKDRGRGPALRAGKLGKGPAFRAAPSARRLPRSLTVAGRPVAGGDALRHGDDSTQRGDRASVGGLGGAGGGVQSRCVCWNGGLGDNHFRFPRAERWSSLHRMIAMSSRAASRRISYTTPLCAVRCALCVAEALKCGPKPCPHMATGARRAATLSDPKTRVLVRISHQGGRRQGLVLLLSTSP